MCGTCVGDPHICVSEYQKRTVGIIPQALPVFLGFVLFETRSLTNLGQTMQTQHCWLSSMFQGSLSFSPTLEL